MIGSSGPSTASLDSIEGSTPRAAVSVTTFAIVASALLIYVSQAFLLSSILGIKRELQAILIIPIALAACYYIVSQPSRLAHPLIGFSMVKLGTELALRGQWSYILDSLASAFALVVLVCAPARSFEIGVKFLVRFAGILALMALVQWVMLFQDPTLAKFVIEVSDDGAMLNTIENPIALLALHGDLDYSLLGHQVVRMQSFGKEPSLNVLYFVLPACLAFLREHALDPSVGKHHVGLLRFLTLWIRVFVVRFFRHLVCPPARNLHQVCGTLGNAGLHGCVSVRRQVFWPRADHGRIYLHSSIWRLPQ